MENIKIATAQFENKSGDKKYNLDIIKDLSAKAAKAGAQVIAFHECSITGYSFARKLSHQQMLDLAEPVPDGPSVQELISIARDNKIVILAGLFEKDAEGKIYKPYVCPCRQPFHEPGTSFQTIKFNPQRCRIFLSVIPQRGINEACAGPG